MENKWRLFTFSTLIVGNPEPNNNYIIIKIFINMFLQEIASFHCSVVFVVSAKIIE